MPEATTERIGIIFVHGIGEQRRFEHLDSELRALIDAIMRRSGKSSKPRATIEIVGGQASTLRADQDTWGLQSGAPVRAIIDENGVRKELLFHEVWWADVNEPYSLGKQINFWLWGLSVWANPSKPASNLSGAEAMMAPAFGTWGLRDEMIMRAKLFGVGNVFAMAAFSLGAALFFAKRLFGFSAPDIVRVFVNYISSVKLYSQRRRSDGGFLDAYLDPPRVSIRRRMIRTITDVALNDYSRWYIFAHSLGSVVAYNGIMENAHALANYLDEQRWKALVLGIGVGDRWQRFAGPGRQDKDLIGPPEKLEQMIPARPLWLQANDVVYRDEIFAKFRGLFTYGSPLDKFAAIWPARVPINVKEPAFGVGPTGTSSPGAVREVEWINAYDPTDPVAATLDAFSKPKGAVEKSTIEPRNFGYAAHPILLYSHLCYLRGRKGRADRLVDRIMQWVLSGQTFSQPTPAAKGWFDASSSQARRRQAGAWAMWLIVYLGLVFLGALTVPLWHSLFVDGGGALAKTIGSVWSETFGWTGAPHATPNVFLSFVKSLAMGCYQLLALSVNWVASWVIALCNHWTSFWYTLQFMTSAYFTLPTLVWTMLQLSIAVVLFTFGVGSAVWLFRFQRDRDDTRPPPSDQVKSAVQAVGRSFSAGTGRPQKTP